MLHAETEHHGYIAYRFIYKEIIWLFVAPVVVLMISYWLTRSVRKAALISLLVLFVFYFFGEIKDQAAAAWPGRFWQSYGFLLPLILVLLAVSVVLVYKRRSAHERSTLYINLAVLLFCLSDLSILSLKNTGREPDNNSTYLSFTPCTECIKPDIYYLIFDSYTSTLTLNSEFSYPNRAIESWLTAKGFTIVQHSRSNYNLTPFSIGSTLNMNYLPGVDTIHKYFLKNYLPAVENVYYNQLVPVLEKMGYEVFNHSIFNMQSHPTTVEAFDTWGTRKLFEQHNLIKKLNEDIGWHFPAFQRFINGDIMAKYSINRDLHDDTAFAHIMRTAKQQTGKPKFVYGHIFKPHSPYTYDSSGMKIPFRNYNPQEDKKAYVQQVVYVNDLIKRVVDTILHNSKMPVIIIQGDHGYRFFDANKKSLEFHNFNAVYYPDGAKPLLHDSLTNVNTFRVLLNTCFKQKYPLLNNQFNFIRYK